MRADLSEMTRLEVGVRKRFTVREEPFAHGEIAWRMLVPRSADDLLDEEAFAKDERMPYWAELWPAAKALARWLIDQPQAGVVAGMGGRWIELGCGLALPSLILKSRGMEVLATDFNEDALLFARVNALRNRLDEIETALLDWREPNPELGEFDVAIAADVLYEQRNSVALAEFLPRILATGGRFILADPGQWFLSHFEMNMKQRGWAQHELAEISEAGKDAKVSRIRILEFVRA